MRTGGNLPDGTPFKPSGLLGQYWVPKATSGKPLTLAEKARLAALKAEEETAARVHARRTPAEKRAYTLNNKRIEASLAAQEKLYKDEQAAKRTAAETAAKIARIKNPPPRNAPFVTPPRIASKDKLTDAKIKRAEEAALRKNPPPDPNAPKPTKQPPTPKPVERPAPKPNYSLPRTKNDITGNRNNALRAAGEAKRANPGESRHHEYLLNHEGVRVSRVKPSTPVVPTPTIPTNFERPAPKLKPYTPTSVLTGIPKPRTILPMPGYMLGQRSPSPLDQRIIRRNWEFAAPWVNLNNGKMTEKEAVFLDDRYDRSYRGEVPQPVLNYRGYALHNMQKKEYEKRHAKLARPYTPTSKLTGIPKPRPKPTAGYALGQRPGQLALFPRGNNEGVVRRGAGEDTSPQLKPTKVSAKQLQLELPNPNPRKDPPLQYTPPKPPPNTGKGRLVPEPKSDIKISGPTTYRRIPNGTRGAIRGAKGFGGGALSVLGLPLAYGVAFGIKERSFSGFLKGLDVWAGGGTPSRGPDA